MAPGTAVDAPGLGHCRHQGTLEGAAGCWPASGPGLARVATQMGRRNTCLPLSFPLPLSVSQSLSLSSCLSPCLFLSLSFSLSLLLSLSCSLALPCNKEDTPQSPRRPGVTPQHPPDDDAVQEVRQSAVLRDVGEVGKAPLRGHGHGRWARAGGGVQGPAPRPSAGPPSAALTSSLKPMCIPQSSITFLPPMDTRMQLRPTSWPAPARGERG